MGGWQLEVFRMFLYVSFPVGMFHYFNHSTHFEEWIIQEREKHFPPVEEQKKKQLQDFIYNYNIEKDKKRLQEMEEMYKKKILQ